MITGDITQLIRRREKLTLPDGKVVEVLYFDPHCENCGVSSETQLCSTCTWLSETTLYKTRMWGETEGLVNRRWQMYHNRGQIWDPFYKYFRAGCWPLRPRWETKRKEQDW